MSQEGRIVRITGVRAALSALLAVCALAFVSAPSAAQTRAERERTAVPSKSAQAKPARQANAAQRPAPRAEGRAQRGARATATPSKGQARAPARNVRGKRVARAAPERPSLGRTIGLHNVDDPLDLKSSVALVVDQETDEVLFSKNSDAVLPIASITKLMTAMVVVDAQLPMAELLSVSPIDASDTGKTSRSRLQVGAELSRGELMHLALMASENRAAYTLGRNFPGGMDAFVAAMNRKASELGMHDTRYVEPTGLSSQNRSSARDLKVLVKAAMDYPQLRELSTSHDASVAVGSRQLQFRNTNGLVGNPLWEIGLQKTGYISEAGRCVVMQAQLAGRKLIMVLLDSAGRYSRIGDAERLRSWLVGNTAAAAAAVPAVTR